MNGSSAEVSVTGTVPAGQSALASTGTAELPELVIEPPRGWVGLNWAELYRYRELLYFLVWRDFTVRYKQTVLGVAWAIVQPTFQMVVFTIIFGRLAGLSSEGYPYAVFSYAALLPWQFFSSGVSTAGMSLVSQQHLMTKVYFPRLYVPTSAIGTCLVDFCLASLVFAGVLAWFGVVPSWQIVFVPLLLVAVAIATLGLGYWLAALTVTYRDLRFVVPFLMQALMYLSPVVYSAEIVPEAWRPVAAINPMYGLIDAFRSAIFGREWNFEILAISITSSVVLLVVGVLMFRRTEQRFADIA
jgi:lipopolysaccharide transport system permease protein